MKKEITHLLPLGYTPSNPPEITIALAINGKDKHSLNACSDEDLRILFAMVDTMQRAIAQEMFNRHALPDNDYARLVNSCNFSDNELYKNLTYDPKLN